MTAAEVSTQATRSSLELLSAGIVQAAELAMRAGVRAAEDSAKGTTLWKDRRPLTRSTIHGEVHGTRGILKAGGAAHFLEWGTSPHIITAKHAKALRFVVGGEVIFRQSVSHPGTKPRPFMREAAQRGEQALDYGADVYVSHAIEHVR